MKRVLLWVLALLLLVAAGFGVGALTYEPPEPEFEEVSVSVVPGTSPTVVPMPEPTSGPAGS